ncbi:MAG TPA: PAS domain-containing protein [Actinomycetota bacterium]|nr:PAS domain-containing protein [Actinomycetota bacterium]
MGRATRRAPQPAAPEHAVLRPGETVAALTARYQALVEQIPAVLYINLADESESTIYVSPQTEPILGIAPDAWFSGTWSDHVHPDDRAQVDENYQAFLRSAREGVDEYRFIRPDGREIWIHDRVSIIRDAAGAPILVQGVMFDITEQKRAQAIIAQQAELMGKMDAVSRRFTDLVLSGAELRRVLDTLAAIVGNPVVLEDAAHQLVEYAERSLDLGELLRRWDTHSRSGHPRTGTGGVMEERTADPPCAWISVRFRQEEWGRIHLLQAEGTIQEIDRLALDRAAAAIGLSLLTERDAARSADTARSAFLSDVWRGRWVSAHEVIARARSLGAELQGRSMVAIVVEVGDPPQPATTHSDPAERRRTREVILDAIREAVGSSNVAGLTAIVGERLVGILGLPGGEDRATLDHIGRTALGRIADRLPGPATVIGVSRRATPETLQRALTEASEAAAYGMRVADRPGIHHFEDLGLLQLLVRLSDGPELPRFVESELGPLLERDAAGRTPLLQTLRTFLESGGHKAAAARALHLERRSLYYRLENIEHLLGRGLDDAATRLRLEVAFQGLDLLQQRAART